MPTEGRYGHGAAYAGSGGCGRLIDSLPSARSAENDQLEALSTVAAPHVAGLRSLQRCYANEPSYGAVSSPPASPVDHADWFDESRLNLAVGYWTVVDTARYDEQLILTQIDIALA